MGFPDLIIKSKQYFWFLGVTLILVHGLHGERGVYVKTRILFHAVPRETVFRCVV
jgi:hypothetical protein